MVITVTQEDINAGKEGDCSQCPVALAYSRALGGAKVHAGPSVMYPVATPNDVQRTPLTVRDFMRRFDYWGPSNVEPFSFTITEPAATP